MAESIITYSITLAWWYRYFYLPIICFVSYMFDISIDENKLDYWTQKAITMRRVNDG